MLAKISNSQRSKNCLMREETEVGLERSEWLPSSSSGVGFGKMMSKAVLVVEEGQAAEVGG